MEGGPWYFGGRPILLKPWTPGMILSKDGYKRIPIWVRFFNIPLEFWIAEGLSRIASTVGSPIHADQMTSSLKRLAYARICLEINSDDPLPASLDLLLEDGRSVEVTIEYAWVPKRCSTCRGLGHLPKNCTKTVRQAWIPKTVNPHPETPKTPGHSNSNSQGLLIRPEESGLPAPPPDNPPSPVLIAPAEIDPCSSKKPSGTSLLEACDISNTYAPVQNSPTVADDEPPADCQDGKAPRTMALFADSPLERSGNCSTEDSSTSSFSSTPKLARMINMVDELEMKMGRKPRLKKKKKRRGGKLGGASSADL